MIQFGGVDLDGALHLGQQVLVIDDVAEVLGFAVEAVDATDRLEETMVLHRFVDVEIGAGRGIKTGE